MSTVNMDNLVPITDLTWKRASKNLLNAELASWFKTRRWVIQSIIWLLAINLIVFFTTIGVENANLSKAKETFFLFSIFAGIWPTFGSILVASSSFTSEKRSGTVSWVLSKPVSRRNFILTKLLSNSVGAILTMVIIPGIVVYVHIGLWTGNWLWIDNFVLGLIVLSVNVLYYLTFTFLMGTFFEKTNQTNGAGMAMMVLLMMLLPLLPFSEYYIPLNLVIPFNGSGSLTSTIMTGNTPANYNSLFIAVAHIIIFIMITLRRFQKEEL